MDANQVRARLDEAAERYNDGRYDEAIRLWREILAHDPSNQKAREGIRMASLLTGEQDGSSQRSRATASEPDDPEAAEVLSRIEAGLARVRELMGAGQFAQALEGCTLLEEIAPGVAEVRALTEEVHQAVARGAGSATRPRRAERTSETTPLSGPERLERHMEQARRALADGRNEEAARAARLALELDPSNAEAGGILSLVGGDEEIVAGAPGGAETGPLPAFDLEGGPIPIEDEPGPATAPVAPPVPVAGGRIGGLLTSGQEAFDAGRYQEAVEIWSRVFAIDQSNAEAGQRIDRAKAAIEEQARQVDDLYYRAVDANEANRLDEALGLFEQVLAISPHHQEARSFIEEINLRLSGLGEAIRVDESAAVEAAEEKKRQLSMAGITEPATAEPPPVLLADISPKLSFPPRISPAPPRVGASRPAVSPAPHSGGARRVVTAVAGIVVVGVAGVGAWLWIGSDSGSIPEARATVPVPVTRPSRPPGKSPTSKAGVEAGPAAPTDLKVVPGAAPAEPEPRPPVTDPEDLKRRSASLTRDGREFYRQERWAEAVLAFHEALAADPVDFDAQDLLDKAMVQLEKQARVERDMAAAVKAFNEKDHATALQKFYRLQQDHSEMDDLETYIRNSWFNWGVTLLQEGAPDEAAEKFEEVLAISRDDKEAAKARDFAKRYHSRSHDAVYETFAKALSLRLLDQR